MEKIKILLLGSGFIADIHAESYCKFVSEAEIIGVYSRDGKKAEMFSGRYGITNWYTDIDRAIQESGCDIVDVCLPNFLHCKAVVAAAKANKHVIVEKPLCITLEEGEKMLAACSEHGVYLMYAEELCFAPKYERVRKLVDEGAVGSIYMLHHGEKHSGPHSDWFYDVELSGGGVMMDMGCHSIAWFRWMMGTKPRVKSVNASMSTVFHKGRTKGEDNAIVILEYDNGVTGVIETSWAKHGGMEDAIKVYGTSGVSYADLFFGNSALTYSESGYGYVMEKAGSSKGWTFTIFEEVYNQGYPHELRYFVSCVREGKEPYITGELGMEVLEVIYAAYESAKTGQKVYLPFRPQKLKPIELWLE